MPKKKTHSEFLADLGRLKPDKSKVEPALGSFGRVTGYKKKDE